MRKLLAIVVIMIILALYFMYCGIFPTLQIGSVNAAIQAGASLLTIWAVIVAFSITAMGLIFQLSSLPESWRLKLFGRVLVQITPFLILAFLAGIIPFLSIMHIQDNIFSIHSIINGWLVIGFVLQLFLIVAATLAAKQAHDSLTLIPAINLTLSTIDEQKIDQLKESFAVAFGRDYDEGRRETLAPMSGLGSDLSGDGKIVHEELLNVFNTLMCESDPQILDSGISAISDWAKSVTLKKLDGYLEYRLIPSCFRSIRIDQASSLSAVLGIRFYYVIRLMDVMRENGAYLTWANSANLLWELIEDYSRSAGMTNTLNVIETGLTTYYMRDIETGKYNYIFLNNLMNGIQTLVAEKTTKSLLWVNRIFEMYIQYLSSKKFSQLNNIIDRFNDDIKIIYQTINKSYGDEPALVFVRQDIRYWIIVRLRRVQEAFVQTFDPSQLNATDLPAYEKIYDVFESLITKLLNEFIPEGDSDSYTSRHKTNPYQKRVNGQDQGEGK